MQNIRADLKAIDEKLDALKDICVEILTQSKQNNLDLANFRNVALPLIQNIDGGKLSTFVEAYYFQFHIEYLTFFYPLF